ncbi:MAG: PAS domain S-box protein [Fidelibacterota bacterium]|nr:MAG: PAS domain S-box protein [Candidatus Neomarinimicrobiota bacterium]
MMGNKKPTYEELERQLTDAEAIIATLHRGEVDAIISERTVALLRVAELEEALRRSEENFRNSLERSPLGVCIVTAEEEILYANQAMLDICGYSSVDELKAVPFRDHCTTESFAEHQEREEKRKRGDFVPSDYEISILRKDGVVRHLAVSRAEVTWNGQRQFEALYQDITERKKAQEALEKAHIGLEDRVKERTADLEVLTEKLRSEIHERQQIEESLNRLYRAYLMVCECNQELIRITDEKSLFDKICSIIIETGGYRLVWVGFAEYDEKKTVRPVASSGYEKGYLENIHITWTDEPAGRGPTGTAIRTGKPAIAKNIPSDPQFAPWRSEAIKRGYASSIALPLRMDHENIGSLNIYAKEPEAFDDDEVNLLIKLADNLAYGIKSLRTRTERDRAGHALRESEELYRTLVETAPDGVSMNDPEGRLIYVSQRTLELFGYERAEELIGRSVLEFIIPDEHEKAIRNIQKTLEEGSIREEEVTLIRKNGTHFIGGINATLLKDPEGQPMAFIVTTRDITERKKMEGALRELEQMLRELYENTTEGIFRITQDGEIIYANEAIASMFGYENAEEFLKINIRSLYPNPGDRQQILSRFEAEDHVRNLELCLRRKDGSIIWVEENANATRDDEGNIKWYQGFISDITARKQAEEELRDLSERFQNLSAHLQSMREKERTGLAREIHDELGQSLTALQIDLSRLRDGIPTDQADLTQRVDAMYEFVDAIIESTQKISTQLRPVLLDTLGLSAAIEWQVDEFQKRTGIHCDVMINAEDSDLDPEQSTGIFRILQESLTNVSRHAKATEVKVSFKQDDQGLMLEVVDNGIGIEPAQVSDSMAYGLIGMRERIRPWKGEVHVSGRKGRGTMVTVRIPVES